jgi:hypothetical protein
MITKDYIINIIVLGRNKLCSTLTSRLPCAIIEKTKQKGDKMKLTLQHKLKLDRIKRIRENYIQELKSVIAKQKRCLDLMRELLNEFETIKAQESFLEFKDYSFMNRAEIRAKEPHYDDILNKTIKEKGND